MIEKIDWSKVLSKHRYEILEQVFMEKPPDIFWFEILGLFEELKDKIGGEIMAPPGRNVRVQLNGQIGVFAEPDPNLLTASFNIGKARKFLICMGVMPSSRPKGFFPRRLKN